MRKVDSAQRIMVRRGQELVSNRHERRRMLLLQPLESRMVLAAVGGLGEITLLDQTTLEAIGESAAQYWRATGLTAEQNAALDAINYGILDLGGNALGAAQGFAILVDVDAAGRGWFVDATPGQNEEFSDTDRSISWGEEWLRGGAVDLLTTVMHEQGHVLGLLDVSDDRADLMFGTLNAGERRLPTGNQSFGAEPGSVTELAFIKLNDDLPAGGDVFSFKISPDSSWVVYNADGDDDGVYELYSRAIDGSDMEVKLNDSLPVGGNVLNAYLITPDSSRVVYLAEGDTVGVEELYSRAIDGSGIEVKLNDPLPTGGSVSPFSLTISPDSSRVVYLAEGDTKNVQELYSRAIDGSGSEAKLNDPLPPGGNVLFGMKVSPDSARVVYIADGDTNDQHELYSRAIDGSGVEVKLNDGLPTDGDVGTALISPDSSRVVYLADGDTNDVQELYSRAIDGSGTEQKLNDALPPGGDVFTWYQISPDSSRVVYTADGDTNDTSEIYSRAIDGSGSEVKLNDALPAGGDVDIVFQITANSSRVVYRADGDIPGVTELYSRPIDGSGAEVKLNSSLPTGGFVIGFKISDDSSRVVYVAEADASGVREIYSRAIDGSGNEVKLNDALPTGGDVFFDFLISPDSSRVVYLADGDNVGVDELYSRLIDGSGSEIKLNDPLPTDGDVSEFNFLISPDSSRVVYLADGDTDEVVELYSELLDVDPATPKGPEAAVNNFITGAQTTHAETRAVAANASGNYIVAFSGWGAGDTQGIFARRYNSSDTPLGPQFRVNQTTSGNQLNASAAMGAGGESVVAWSGKGVGDNDGGVFVRLISNTGTLVGGEIRVNQTTASTQHRPNVAKAPDGSFIVTWSGKGPGDVDSGVFARRFAANGTPLSAEFRVNTSTFFYQQQPDVAFANDGSFVITWSGYGVGGDYSGVYFQRYSASGVALGTETRVNATISGPQVLPSVGIEATGDFVITWSGFGTGDSRGVFLQRFDHSGNPIGSNQRVNTHTPYDQEDASVSVAPSGTFVVTWTSWYQDGSGRGVYGQEYDNFGAKLGGEFLVSNTTFTDQRFSSVATKGDSGFVAAWSGRGIGDTTGVFVRSYNRPAPLMASQGENTPGLADTLTSIELDGIHEAALRRFEDAGATAQQLARLASVDVQIVDLSPGVLGTSNGHAIQIDLNAAGWGWFVDATPGDDNEFTVPADGPAAGKIDLLSAVLHEMSHVLEYGHTDHGVMAETLGRGIRQADLDALFADVEQKGDGGLFRG